MDIGRKRLMGKRRFRVDIGKGKGMVNGIQRMVFRNSKWYSENGKGKNGIEVG